MNARSESSSPPAEAGRTAQAVAIGLILLTVSWALLHAGFWHRSQIIDTPVYQGFATKILDGEVPYRDFPVEYPPAALPVFVLPALAESERYASAFEILMWACGVAALVLVAATLTRMGASGPRLYAAVAFLGLAPLALGSVILSRFDLWPAALAAGVLAALLAERDRLGFGLLGLATAAKLYPGVVLPVAFVWVAKRRGWREATVALAVFLGVVLAVFLPFAIVSPGGVWDSFAAQLSRPLQIESLGAALLLAGHQLGLYDPVVVSTHGSQNLDGGLPDALASVQTAFQVIALVAVWVAFSRGRPGAERLVIGCAAAVAAFIAFGKVLSPQFLIWLVPLVPLVAGRRGLGASALLGVALVLTQLWFPFRYWDYAREFDAAVAWNGSEFVVAYGDFRNDGPYDSHRGDLYAERIADTGTILDPGGFEVMRDTIPEMFPAVAGSGGAFIVGDLPLPEGRTVSGIELPDELFGHRALPPAISAVDGVVEPFELVHRDSVEAGPVSRRSYCARERRKHLVLPGQVLLLRRPVTDPERDIAIGRAAQGAVSEDAAEDQLLLVLGEGVVLDRDEHLVPGRGSQPCGPLLETLAGADAGTRAMPPRCRAYLSRISSRAAARTP